MLKTDGQGLMKRKAEIKNPKMNDVVKRQRER